MVKLIEAEQRAPSPEGKQSMQVLKDVAPHLGDAAQAKRRLVRESHAAAAAVEGDVHEEEEKEEEDAVGDDDSNDDDDDDDDAYDDDAYDEDSMCRTEPP